MSAQPKVRFVQDGALAVVTLDSPPLNQIGRELIADLVAAIGEAERADGLRALVLRGDGNVLGIVPLAGGVQRVAARAGLGRARALAIGGNLYSAQDLAAWGAIDRVVAADELHSVAEEFARRLAAGPTRAFAVVKELARAYTTDGVPGADRLLLDAAVGLFDTEDARGGISSFLQSGPGKATFAGR
jgi:enoyl-CoA hydratase/carnithine racemase